MKKTEKMTVWTEQKIQQKMAGYKAAYTRMVNGTTGKAREQLENNRETWLNEKLEAIQNENKERKHQIRVAAAYKAWDTIRSKKTRITSTDKTQSKHSAKPQTKKNHRGSKVGIRVINH